MSFYDSYYLKYIAADKATRKEAEDYWTGIYKNNPYEHAGKMIITIALANNYLANHTN